jgi:hypothetical protein
MRANEGESADGLLVAKVSDRGQEDERDPIHYRLAGVFVA